jgi:hypothetical protein
MSDETLAEFVDRRSDPKKTSARHNEVLRLRVFLTNIREELRLCTDKRSLAVRGKITKLMQTWGDEDDCI